MIADNQCSRCESANCMFANYDGDLVCAICGHCEYAPAAAERSLRLTIDWVTGPNALRTNAPRKRGRGAYSVNPAAVRSRRRRKRAETDPELRESILGYNRDWMRRKRAREGRKSYSELSERERRQQLDASARWRKRNPEATRRRNRESSRRRRERIKRNPELLAAQRAYNREAQRRHRARKKERGEAA